MKKQLLLFAMILLPLVASADPVEIDGIYYNLVSKTKIAEVTSNPQKYTGSITIPESVNYENVVYSVKEIGESAFSYCSGLTSVTIPNNVTSIGKYAFYDCNRLPSITIPNSVTSIGESAFYFCSSLTSVIIPNSVTKIGSNAFYKCSSLTSVIIPNSVTSIEGGVFASCTKLTSVTIPNSVTSIEVIAFQNCSSLTSVTIGNSVTNIGDWAFNGCASLTTVTIGSGIKTIGGLAFAACPNLTDVTCQAESLPNTNVSAFKDSYIEYATLHVPSASIDAYKAADPWKNFKSIVAINGGTTSKCEKPTISYENGQLKMSCATEGVEYVTDITDADIKKHYDATISLTATYNISVYATNSGYDNSETATATLCWIDASPKTEGITDGVVNVTAKAVLIKSNGGLLTVEGVDDGESVAVYTTDGVKRGSAICQNGVASIDTNIQSGNVAIVRIGQKSVKVVVK